MSVYYLLIFLKKNIGLRFCMLGIQLVFLRIFGVCLNTQDSECMRNYWQTLFAAFFAVFVAVVLAAVLGAPTRLRFLILVPAQINAIDTIDPT